MKKSNQELKNEIDQILGVPPTSIPIFPYDKTSIVDIQDPKQAHQLYEDINKLLKKYLPKCPKPNYKFYKNPEVYQEKLKKHTKLKKIRELIREEVNTFITSKRKSGLGIRGRSGRSAYISKLIEALDIIKDWVNEGANLYNLYEKFEHLNQQLDDVKK